MEREVELVQRVKAIDAEFRRLVEEHEHFEEQLQEFAKLRFLTPEQELERNRIKKMKLRGKDQMARILQRYKCQDRLPTH